MNIRINNWLQLTGIIIGTFALVAGASGQRAGQSMTIKS